MNPNEREQLTMIRSLKGPPATILLMLLLRNASMTNLEICQWTGYSPNTVTPAMRLLDSLGFTQYNGRSNGWSIVSGIQLSLPVIHSLQEPVDKEIANFAIYDAGESKEIAKFAISDDEQIANFAISASQNADFSHTRARAHHDHDDHDDEEIVIQLLNLDFHGAEHWIRGRNKRQIEEWLMWLDDPANRRKITNPAAFIRAKVEKDAWPPPTRPQREFRELANQVPDHLKDIIRH